MSTRMQLSSWDKSLMVGIDSVDAQHRAILSVLDKLSGRKDNTYTQECISESMSELGTLLSAHFKHEERLIKSCGMSHKEVDAHLDKHKQILEQFVTINMEAMSGRQRNLQELSSIIRSWAVDHVLEFDLKLRDYRWNIGAG